MSFRIATSDGVAELVIDAPVATTRAPSESELRLLRERLDPGGMAAREPLG